MNFNAYMTWSCKAHQDQHTINNVPGSVGINQAKTGKSMLNYEQKWAVDAGTWTGVAVFLSIQKLIKYGFREHN